MKIPFLVAAPMLLALVGTAVADDLPEYTLVVKNHVYQLTLPARNVSLAV